MLLQIALVSLVEASLEKFEIAVPTAFAAPPVLGVVVFDLVSEQPPRASATEAAAMAERACTQESLRQTTLASLTACVVGCRACPRLVAWRERVARERRAAYAAERYWGAPVPGFGDPAARIMLLGLAPAAHGANRTGRMFTGDRSGDFLYAALWRAGLASQPTAVSRDDGLELRGCYVTAAVRCAPPDNRPTPAERDRCLPYARREIELLRELRVVVCLGAFAWDAALAVLELRERPRPRFAHASELARADAPVLLGSYHPSQQNTFTGRLTEPMLDAVLARALVLAGLPAR
jgi:uracil-DNA glycosylase family 4